MSDSFFGFDTTLESGDALDGPNSDEDEEGFDALNHETFGDDPITDDWEQNHEKLAEITELSRNSSINKENGDLSAQMAAFILDDESMSDDPVEPIKPTRPPPGFGVPSNNSMCTVEEIERNLIKQNSMRLEDLERRIILQQNQDLLNVRPNQQNIQGFLKSPQGHNLLNSQLSKTSSLFPLRVAPPQVPNVPNIPFMLPLNVGPWSRIGSQLVRNPLEINRIIPPTIQQQIQTLKQQQMHKDVNEDEYAGLMTLRERNWLASLQTMQISSNQPFQDDYYYLMYTTSHSGNHNRKLGSLGKNQRDTPTLIKPIYTPLQFENSLGKLQVGSVMAPRKIIDMEIVENIDCSSVTSASKKVKQILLEIEHMFSTILLAEEAISPLANHDREDREPINPVELFQRTVNSLLKDDKLNAVLNIRKGKTLVLRILPHMEVSSPLVRKLIMILPVAAKRDSEQNLLSALPPIRHYLSSCTLDTLLELSTSLRRDFVFLLQNKLGISVLANMIERAEILISQDPSAYEVEDWLVFVGIVVEYAKSAPNDLERPVVAIPGPTLAKHLARLPKPASENFSAFQKALSNLSNVEKG